MDIFAYLKKLGLTTVDSAFYYNINLWQSWYKGYVANVHSYKVYNGKNSIHRRRLSLQMAKKVCEDIADFLFNEKVSVTISEGENESTATSDYVQDVLSNNKFWVKCNEFQERKAATGTSAYVCQIINGSIMEDGSILGGEVEINYVSAENIFPLSWNNGSVKECAFVFPKTIFNKQYAVIQIHQIHQRVYVITNHVVECTNGSSKEIEPEDWLKFKEFATLAREINTGSNKPQFVIDRLNIANNVSDCSDSPMGISIFANSLDVLAKIDVEYDSYENEFSLGRKRVFVAPEMLSSLDGTPVFDSNDTVFYQLPEDMKSEGKPITELNMDIRADEHEKAINGDLKLLSFKIGFGTEYYKFEKGTVQTATQVISENSDLFRTIKKHEVILRDVITDLIKIIIRLGIVCGVPGLNEDADIKIDFDDSIIEDKESERSQDRQDVAMGVMSLAEYRAKWYGETEEETDKKLPSLTDEVIP